MWDKIDRSTALNKNQRIEDEGRVVRFRKALIV